MIVCGGISLRHSHTRSTFLVNQPFQGIRRIRRCPHHPFPNPLHSPKPSAQAQDSVSTFTFKPKLVEDGTGSLLEANLNSHATLTFEDSLNCNSSSNSQAGVVFAVSKWIFGVNWCVCVYLEDDAVAAASSLAILYHLPSILMLIEQRRASN